MTTKQDLNDRTAPAVRLIPSLEKYKGKVLLPEKLAKEIDMLKTAKLPNKKQRQY